MSDAPKTESQEKPWMILSMQKTLPYLNEVGGVFGAHNYIALANPDGKIVREMHGVPSVDFTFGVSQGNYLQVRDLIPGQYLQDHSVESKKLVMTGAYQEMKAKYDTAYDTVAKALDKNHELYAGARILGHAVNSNSVWNSALLAMGVDKPSHYDGPLSTPGNAVDLRLEPTNNSLLGKPEDNAIWSPNPARMNPAPTNPPEEAPQPAAATSNSAASKANPPPTQVRMPARMSF